MKCKTIAEFGRSDLTILSIAVPLWTKSDTSSLCPAQLPFEVPPVTSFTRNDYTGAMPPSFEYTFADLQGGTPGLVAKIKYEISVEVKHNNTSLKDRLTAT